MRRVLPTQVVAFIDSTLPKSIKEQVEDLQKTGTVDLPPVTYAAPLRMVVRLVDEIPAHLLNVDEKQYFRLLTAVEAVRSILAQFDNSGGSTHLALEKVPGLDKKLNPITIIRQILLNCPDELPSPQSHQLAFIQDAAFRGGLQTDIASIDRALNENEWKTATVLAGSVIEAVLLWALDEKHAAVAGEPNNRAKSLKLKCEAHPLVEWDLHCFVEVAADLKIIDKDTKVSAALAKNFRNLIHPGRAVRQQQQCDRGTAFSATAALDHVVRDVEKWIAAGKP